MSNKVYIGHSYGSLLGIHMLLTEPTMFRHYILGSPSLWFGKRELFSAERAYAALRHDLPANVMMFAGRYEEARPGSKNPRFNTDVDLVRDMLAFEKQLKSHRYQGLSVRAQVLEDEDHLTVFPVMATRGLMWALPNSK